MGTLVDIPTRPVYIPADATSGHASVTVTAVSAAVYYGADPSVTVGGGTSVAQGATVTLTAGRWFVSQFGARAFVEESTSTTAASQTDLNTHTALTTTAHGGLLASTDFKAVNPRLEAYGFWPAEDVPTSSQQLIVNLLYYKRFVPKRSITATGIAFAVTTAANNNDTVDVALLDASANRLASSGPTASLLNSTGAKELSFTASYSLVAGTEYFAAMVAAVAGTGAFLAAWNFGNASLPMLGCQTVGTPDKYVVVGARANGSATIGTTPGLPNSLTTTYCPGMFIRGT
jgi:hypothetical protein